MNLPKVKPDKDQLSFQLMDHEKCKKNTLYLTDTLHSNGQITVLQLDTLSKTPLKLSGSETGNVSAVNFTFCLIIPVYLVDMERIEALELVDHNAEPWDCWVDKDLIESENELHIYLLYKKEIFTLDKQTQFLFRNIPFGKLTGAASHIGLGYRMNEEPDTVYCQQTWLDILNHSGNSNSPFKLFNDTPVISNRKGENLTLRLMNSTNAALTISDLQLRIRFDVYEEEVKSPEALVEKKVFQKVNFRVQLYQKEISQWISLGSFNKIQASDQAIYLGMLEFLGKDKNLKKLNPREQLKLEFTFDKANPIPGESSLTINYFGVKDYRDGELTTVVKRSAYTEDKKTNHIVPKGTIVMWSGSMAPQGWVICDGNNGEEVNSVKIPDLRGRFIVGIGKGYHLNDFGGEEKITLSEEQMPKHYHKVYFSDSGFYEGSQGWIGNKKGSTPKLNGLYVTDRARSGSRRSDLQEIGMDHPIQDSGGNQPHENRPPYYALAYIIKV